MKESSIKLSPEHCLNPTMGICMYCGEPTNEIGLLGKINKADDEAPKYSILSYEPCDKCKQAMSQGVTLIGVVTESPDGRPEIQKGLYPTGSYMVLKEEVIPLLFDEETAKKTIEKRMCFVDNEMLINLQEMINMVL